MPKLHIAKTLVLHDYGQQVNKVKKKWFHTFKKIGLTDVHYLSGPLSVINNKNETGKGWFLWDNKNNIDIYKCTAYYNVDKTLNYIYNYIMVHGPFDVIVGYSQGGTILAILLERFVITVRKVIIISSHDSLDVAWYINHTTTYSILLVAGQRDEIVPAAHTVCMYVNAHVYMHDGTHTLPNTKEFITRVKKFLE